MGAGDSRRRPGWRPIRPEQRRYGLTLVGLTAVGVGILVAAGHYAGSFGQDMLINLGVTILGVTLTFLVLEPVIRRSRTPEEIIHSRFPHDRFIAGVRGSSEVVRILSAWPYVMEDPWRHQFLDAVRVAVGRGVPVQVLVLDPTSWAAEQRTQDLGGAGGRASIAEILSHLGGFAERLAPGPREYFDVRVYSALPPARMYRWDGRALSSFFPRGNWRGDNIRHYETGTASGMGCFVDEQFELLWEASATVGLDGFLTLPLRVGERTFGVRYCCEGGRLYVASTALNAHLLSLRGDQSAVRLVEERPAVPFGPGTVLCPQVVEVQSAEEIAVTRHFAKKYGARVTREHGGLVPVRLDPEAAQPAAEPDPADSGSQAGA